MNDLYKALRLHTRRPLLSVAAIATLALGIGLNSAIFSIVHGVLQPLPYPDAENLVRIYATDDNLRTSTNDRLRAIWNRLPVSALDAQAWQEQARNFVRFGLYSEWTVTYLGGGEPLRLEGSRIDSELFQVLDVEPRFGRLFTDAEAERGELPVLLSHSFWQEAFGGGEVLGSPLRLDEAIYTVVGIMPPGFRIAGRSEDRVWAPLPSREGDFESPNSQYFNVVARKAPGVSLSEAHLDLHRITSALAAGQGIPAGTAGVRLVPLLDDVVGDSRILLYLLLAAVTVVLLIACVNVAQLLLAQAVDRRKEFALCFALGASYQRMVQQLLIESLLLGLAGGGLGLLLARRGQELLLRWIPADLPRTQDVGMDAGVLVFTLAMSLFASFLAGALPALLLSDVDSEDLKSTCSGYDRRTGNFHNGFVIAEIALALVLTTVAGLLTSHFLRLHAVDPGFDTEGVLVQEIALPEWSYVEAARREDFTDRLLPTLARLPVVKTTALTTKLPLPGTSLVGGFQLPGEAQDEASQDWIHGNVASLKFVTANYFKTLGIPLVTGRPFSPTDRMESRKVVIVNQALARRAWPQAGEAVLGEVLLMRGGGKELQEFTVVGLARDVHQEGVHTAPQPILYLPWEQPWGFVPNNRFYLVAALENRSATAEIREVIRSLDPALPLAASQRMNELFHHSLGQPRSRSAFVSLFAFLALALAALGIYAMMSFTVRRQFHEIGVRMALGASPSNIRALVLRRTLGLVALGGALGIVLSLAVGKILRGRLEGLTIQDPLPFALAAAALLLVALLAGYLPSKRASRVDPLRALRIE